jgi:hypothetical protein
VWPRSAASMLATPTTSVFAPSCPSLGPVCICCDEHVRTTLSKPENGEREIEGGGGSKFAWGWAVCLGVSLAFLLGQLPHSLSEYKSLVLANRSSTVCATRPVADVKDKFDATAFREEVIPPLADAETYDDAMAFLEKAETADKTAIDYRTYADALFDILICGGTLGAYDPSLQPHHPHHPLALCMCKHCAPFTPPPPPPLTLFAVTHTYVLANTHASTTRAAAPREPDRAPLSHAPFGAVVRSSRWNHHAGRRWVQEPVCSS